MSASRPIPRPARSTRGQSHIDLVGAGPAATRAASCARADRAERAYGAAAAGPAHRAGPAGDGGRGPGRAAAVRRGVVRHGRHDARAVHRARGGGGARRDQAGAPPGRSAARSRACPLRRSTARPLAGPLGASVAAARRRLSLQPRHRGRDRRGRVQPGVEPCWGDAEGPTDRPAADLSGGPPRAGACWRSWARRRRSALRAALTRPSAGGARVGCGRRTAMSGRRIAVAVAACTAGVAGTWLVLADNVEQATSPNVLGLAAVWSFVVSGLVVWHRQPDNRIGPVMVATGLARVAYEFMWVRQPVLATAGHVLAGAHIAGAAFVLRLSDRSPRLDLQPGALRRRRRRCRTAAGGLAAGRRPQPQRVLSRLWP